jgi:hypothetical protein
MPMPMPSSEPWRRRHAVISLPAASRIAIAIAILTARSAGSEQGKPDR